MTALKRELNLLMLALGFLTRLPIPLELNYSEQTLNASSRYFTLVGAFVGLCMAAVYVAASTIWPESVAVLLVLLTNLLLTGCFHQDGLADMADGFGGAFERQRKLEIMKDSRLGTYGSCALIATLALQYGLMLELDSLVIALIVAQALSRALAASIIYNTPYAADPDASKAKPLSQSVTNVDMLILLVSAAVMLLFLTPLVSASLIAVLIVFRLAFVHFLKAQIGGFTGDCLGASQQLSESCIYLTLLAWQGAAL
ncbi:MAG: adenosylcobinamide-GDP ribazoletransferase [Granulosicoccaceae bacterium]